MAARQDVRRAFRFQVDKGYSSGDNEFASLRLNRSVYRPSSLVWGTEHFSSDGYLRVEDHWRSISTQCTSDGVSSNIEKGLKQLLDGSEASIAEYLREDSRWGVFLMNRRGRHEWIPTGMEQEASALGKLDPAILGKWVLASHSSNFLPMSKDREDAGNAEIWQDGDVARITIHTKRDWDRPLKDVANCELRYSGGLTFRSEPGSLATTPLGDLGTVLLQGGRRDWLDGEGKLNGFEPLDPGKQYKQVLMQCKEAEMPDNDRVRFLIVSEDTLIEVAAEWPRCHGVWVRHFVRPSSLAAP